MDGDAYRRRTARRLRAAAGAGCVLLGLGLTGVEYVPGPYEGWSLANLSGWAAFVGFALLLSSAGYGVLSAVTARRLRHEATAAALADRSPLPADALTHRAFTRLLGAPDDVPGTPRGPDDGRPDRWWTGGLPTAVGLPGLLLTGLWLVALLVLGLLTGVTADAPLAVPLLAVPLLYCAHQATVRVRAARQWAAVASSPSRPMRYLVLYGPEPRTAHLLLFPADGGPDAAPEALVRPARGRAERLPASGVAHVHTAPEAGAVGSGAFDGWPAAVLVPRIDGVPVWPADVALLLDTARTPDRAWLTHLVGGAHRMP